VLQGYWLATGKQMVLERVLFENPKNPKNAKKIQVKCKNAKMQKKKKNASRFSALIF
jgi:hypothetical protein